MTNQFYKRKILITGSAIVQKERGGKKQNTKHRATKTSQSVAINSPKGGSNTHDPFKYSVISVF